MHAQCGMVAGLRVRRRRAVPENALVEHHARLPVFLVAQVLLVELLVRLERCVHERIRATRRRMR